MKRRIVPLLSILLAAGIVGLVYADIEVSPELYDFGPVLEGSQEFGTIRIENVVTVEADCRGCHGPSVADRHHIPQPENCTDCHTIVPDPPGVTVERDCLVCHDSTVTVDDIVLGEGSDTDFRINTKLRLPLKLKPGNAKDIRITFSPTSEGPAEAVLHIESDSIHDPFLEVSIAGTGVALEPPGVTMDDILEFFDASIGDGTLEGSGNGRSAENRLAAFRKMLEKVDQMIARGQTTAACNKLDSIYKKTDGLGSPRDFVEGDAAAELAELILQLMEEIGCD